MRVIKENLIYLKDSIRRELGMNRLFARIGGVMFAVIFIVAGGLSLTMGVRRMVKLNTGKYVETQATITRIETTHYADSDTGSRTDYDITVEYVIDGRKYVSQLGEQPSNFYEGMELTVLYNVDNPTDLILPGQMGSYIMIGLGIVGIAAGIAAFFKRRIFV